MARPTKRQQINKKIGAAVSKLTPENIEKLEDIYQLDPTIKEVAFYLDVNEGTIYNWKNENPDLFNRLERLRENPVLIARKTVVAKMGENYSNAMDYLKRKKKLEFGDSVEQRGDVTIHFDNAFTPETEGDSK